jgi:arylsulfatase A-like enzyme
MLIAGGGVRGGRVVGASDAIASEPRDQPIHAARVASTVLHALGVDSRTTIPDADGNSIPVLEGEPIAELFC